MSLPFSHSIGKCKVINGCDCRGVRVWRVLHQLQTQINRMKDFGPFLFVCSICFLIIAAEDSQHGAWYGIDIALAHTRKTSLYANFCIDYQILVLRNQQLYINLNKSFVDVCGFMWKQSKSIQWTKKCTLCFFLFFVCLFVNKKIIFQRGILGDFMSNWHF